MDYFQLQRTMLRVRLSVLLLIIAHLSLMCAELSHTEEKSSVSGRDKAKRVSCEKGTDCTFWRNDQTGTS